MRHRPTQPVVAVGGVVVRDERVLLILRGQEPLKGHWSLPGGGIQRVEKPIEAAVRETYEETGIRVAVDDVEELGTFKNPDPKKPYTVACFKLVIPKRTPHLAKHRRLEMLDVAWFPISALPSAHSEIVNIALSLLK